MTAGSDEPASGPRRADDIAEATLTLLAEHGFDGLTIEGVADRAGVNKTTIYRWWPSKAALVGAAIRRGRLLEFAVPDTGSFRGDLEALTEHVGRLLTVSPTAEIAQALLVGAARSPELVREAGRFFSQRQENGRLIVDRAIARGEIAPGSVEPNALLDLLNGALWMRAAIRRAPVEEGFAGDIVDLVLTGLLHRGGDHRAAR